MTHPSHTHAISLLQSVRDGLCFLFAITGVVAAIILWGI